LRQPAIAEQSRFMSDLGTPARAIIGPPWRRWSRSMRAGAVVRA